MVPDRMARRRTRANQILSVHAARKHQPPGLGERYQAAVADRARLPGPETGARAGPLRGARVAWLSSSRYAVHRRIRIPDLRTGSDSPLRTKRRHSRRRTSPSRRLSTPADPPIRPERHVPTSITSVRTVIARAIARAVPPCPCCPRLTRRGVYDTVRLEEWEHVLRVNVTGSYLCACAVVPAMRKAGWGRIINISSDSVPK